MKKVIQFFGGQFMKFYKYILLLILFINSPTYPNGQNALSTSNGYFYYRGVRYLMKNVLSDEFEMTIDCRTDTGAVDIVFVIDSTGSMAEAIDNVKANIDAFASELDDRGYDYRFGGVTFGDGANTWDFEPSTPGYQMTSDYYDFRTKLFNVDALGGWDIPEQSLDALEAAMNNYSWRTDAVKVIIFFTDACFCQVGECGSDCSSAYNQSTVYSDLTSSGCVLFAATLNPVYCDMCASIGSAGATNWYQNAASATGGRWFNLYTSWSSIFNSVIALIDTFEVINFCVINNSGSTINPATATLIPGGCISVISDNPITYGPWFAGDEHCFGWRVNTIPGCTGPEACFDAVISGGGYSDTIRGCIFIENCACPGPTATPICPPNSYGIPLFTACESQEIQIQISDPEYSVDESSIKIEVNGTIYDYPASMSFDGTTLTWMPPSPWSSGDTVKYSLLQVKNENGCPVESVLTNTFIVDAEPPEITNFTPSPGTEIIDTILSASADLFDSLSGIDRLNLYYTIQGVEFGLSSPLVSYFGDDYNGTLLLSGTFSQLGISDNGTIEICIFVRDNVPEGDEECDLCGPNIDSLCWEVFAHFGGPVAEIISPQPGQITSCDDQCVKILITDDDGVDISTIRLSVSSTTITDTFSISDPEMLWNNDTLTFCPEVLWQNNEDVHISLIEAADSYGNSLTNPLEWNFYVDVEPPAITNFIPDCGTILHTQSPVIMFDVNDNLSGFDETSLTIIFDGSDILYHSNPAISISGSRIIISTETAGLNWSGGDTIDMCVQVADSPDICAPNDTIQCCRYFVATGGPTAEINRPLNESWSSCDDEYISFTLRDVEGIDTSSIIFTVELSSTHTTHTITSDSSGVIMTGSASDLTVEYHPAASFADGETVDVCIISCEDILGNELEDAPLCWQFFMDTSPPFIVFASPSDGQIIADRTPEISFILDDDGSGVDGSATSITVNGTAYSLFTAGDTFFWSADSAGIEFEGGDSVKYCIHSQDIIDYCENNVLDTCIVFTIQPGPAISDVYFSEETDCDGENILSICYTLTGDTADISVLMSSDGGTTWDVPMNSVSDTAG
ncbi:hypothetical protein DRQ26_01965, partial [bacterium]